MKKVFILLGVACLGLLVVCAGVFSYRQAERCRQLEAEVAELEDSLSQAKTARTSLEVELEKAQDELDAAARRDNPIDEYFYAPARMDLNTGTTIECKVEAGFYCEAWRLEFLHALEWVQARVGDKFPEDRQLLERYQALIEEQAELSWDLSKLRAAGASPQEREGDQQYLFGTMYGEIATLDRAEAYRQGTLWLLDTYSYAEPWDGLYEFHFDDTVRADIAQEGDPMFPPIADVVQNG